MKKLLSSSSYLFNPSSSQIDFTNFPDFKFNKLYAVINSTAGEVIYATGGHSGNLNGSFSFPYLSLAYNTSGMNSTDDLQVIYESDGVNVLDADGFPIYSTLDFDSGKNGLDVNLLNSSFGGNIDQPMPFPNEDKALSIGVNYGGILKAPAIDPSTNQLIIDATKSGNVPVLVNNSVNINGTVSVDNFPATQAVSGSVSVSSSALPSGASTAALQTTGNTSLSSINTKLPSNLTVTATRLLVDGSGVTQPISGSVSVSNFPATQPISAASLPLPTGAATEAKQDLGNLALTSIDNKLNTLGQKNSANSVPVVLPSDQTVSALINDLMVTGQSGQSAIITNVLTPTAGSTALDCLGYKSGSVQVISTATGGTFIFECSNDNVNFQSMVVYNQVTTTGVPTASAITATVSSLIYTFPIHARYIRLRIATTLTVGTIQAFTKLNQASFTPSVYQVAQNTAASLNATVAGSLTTVSTVSAVTSASLSSATTTDIALAGFSATATSANIATTNIQSASFLMNVTIITGTNVTLDIVIQETFDGANYYDIYHFPRITAAGQYRTPNLKLTGIGIRYVRTVAGTTPSITMSAIRISRSTTSGYLKSFIDRSIDPNTLNSVSPAFVMDGCDSVHLCVTMAAGGSSAPVFKLQGSEDQANWFDLGTNSITGNPSTSQAVPYNGLQPKFVRAITSTAGTGAVLTSLCIKGMGV